MYVDWAQTDPRAHIFRACGLHFDPPSNCWTGSFPGDDFRLRTIRHLTIQMPPPKSRQRINLLAKQDDPRAEDLKQCGLRWCKKDRRWEGTVDAKVFLDFDFQVTDTVGLYSLPPLDGEA